MTTATERESRERLANGSVSDIDDVDRRFQSILLTALLTRREERAEDIHPLLLAALTGRWREDRGEDVHPVLLAALMSRREGRREERAEDILPLVVAALAWRHEQQEGSAEDIKPLLFAALAGQR